MRIAAMCLWIATAASAGCLRSTQFTCSQDADCGATGVCEATVHYCSFPSSTCDSGRSFGESAGQGMSNTCVPGTITSPVPDAGIDAPTLADAPVNVGCPSPYASVAGSAHRYKALGGVSWDTAAADCKLTSASAYLAVPDDAPELVNLATVAAAPFWIGIDDQANKGTFVSQKGGTAAFLPWAPNQPDQGAPPKLCVEAVSMTEIATEKCGAVHAAVCECEP